MPFEEETESKGKVTRPSLDNVEIPKTGWLMIQDWIEALPRPWRLFQPLGFFLLGISATTGFRWYDAAHGTTDRSADISFYRVATVLLIVGGAISLVADLALRRETSRPVGTILDYCDHINESLGIERPRGQRSMWARVRGMNVASEPKPPAEDSVPAQAPDPGGPTS